MLQLSSNVFSLMDIRDVISFYVQIDCVSVCFCVVFIFYYFLCVLRVRFYIKKNKTFQRGIFNFSSVTYLLVFRRLFVAKSLYFVRSVYVNKTFNNNQVHEYVFSYHSDDGKCCNRI